MATVATSRAAFNRQPIWLVKLILDQCANEYGSSPCTASGGSCHYTWISCEDTANYDQSSVTLSFINRGAPHLSGCLPLLIGFTPFSTKITQDKFEVSRGEMRFRFAADTAAPFSAMNKTTSPADTGSFWPNLLARNPNYQGRICELYEGYAGVAAADFSLVYRGTIEDWKVSADGAEIMSRDLLYGCKDVKAPASIDDDNVVTDDPLTSVATTVNVTDGTEFLTASAAHPRAVKIEDEYIIYTGTGATTLTGCTRGAYGSTAAAHVAGSAVAQVLAFYTSTKAAGWGADWILAELLYLGGVSADYWMTVDVEVTLDGALNNSATAIPVTNGSALPDTGVGKIDLEWIKWTANSGTSLTAVRGMYGSTAAAHDTATALEPMSATNEQSLWHFGALYGRIVENETNISELIGTLAQDCMADVFMNEDGLVEFSVQAPPFVDESVLTLTHADHWRGTRKVDQHEESRSTRVYVYHSAAAPDPGTDAGNYGGPSAYIGADLEAAANYGKARRRLLFCPWIYRDAEANWLSSSIYTRYQRACPVVTFSLEIYHAALKVGDLVRMTIPEVVDVDGVAVTRTYKVIRREWRPDRLNEILIEAADTGFGDSRFGLICPAMPVLDEDLDDSETEIDLDVAATEITAADFAAGGQVRIGDEKITIGSVSDEAGDVVRLSGCTRGALSTAAATHTTGDQVLMLYSGAATAFRARYVFIGAATTNLLDGDGDGVGDTDGYLFW